MEEERCKTTVRNDVFSANTDKCDSVQASKKRIRTLGKEWFFSPPHLRHHHDFSLYLCPPSLSTFCPLPLASFHLFRRSSPLSLPLPATPVVSHPHRRRGLIIISQARPHQETWLLMREKSILLSLSSLSLPQSIYPLSPLFPHPHPHPPPLPLFFN